MRRRTRLGGDIIERATPMHFPAPTLRSAPAVEPADGGVVSPALTRRRLIAALGLAAAAGLAAGCDRRGLERQAALRRRATPTGAPVGDGETPAAVTPSPVPGLETFMKVSSLLTGFDALDPAIGATYLASLLARPAAGATVGDLLVPAEAHAGAAGTPDPTPGPGTPAAPGPFADEQVRSLANTITTMWYTGLVDQAGETVVATYLEALAWRATSWTRAPTTCGGAMGFWSEPPAPAPAPPG
jgi:hypothetical protein